MVAKQARGMPFAVALLDHPVSAYCLLVTGLAGAIRATYVRDALVSGFGGSSACLLALLSYLHRTPPEAGVVAVLVGAELMIVEFTRPAFGAAALAAAAAAGWGSWTLLAAPEAELHPFAHAALAVGGVGALFAAVFRALRRHALPD
jgi:membrane-bound ClpP family serine protease